LRFHWKPRKFYGSDEGYDKDQAKVEALRHESKERDIRSAVTPSR
jgi:hypothetical protein